MEYGTKNVTLNAFEEKVRLHAGPVPRNKPRGYRSKEESELKNMPRAGGVGGHKKNPKYAKKHGYK